MLTSSRQAWNTIHLPDAAYNKIERTTTERI